MREQKPNALKRQNTELVVVSALAAATLLMRRITPFDTTVWFSRWCQASFGGKNLFGLGFFPLRKCCVSPVCLLTSFLNTPKSPLLWRCLLVKGSLYFEAVCLCYLLQCKMIGSSVSNTFNPTGKWDFIFFFIVSKLNSIHVLNKIYDVMWDCLGENVGINKGTVSCKNWKTYLFQSETVKISLLCSGCLETGCMTLWRARAALRVAVLLLFPPQVS